MVDRQQIGFETSIVLVFLLQILEKFNSNPTQVVAEKFTTKSKIEIEKELDPFLPKRFDRSKFGEKLGKCIAETVEFGYLKNKIYEKINTKFDLSSKKK